MLIDITLRVTPKLAKDAQGNEQKALVGHLGTHFDVMDKEFPLEYIKRRGIVFDVSQIVSRDIGSEDIDLERIEEDMFVLFCTGYLEKVGYGSKEYFSQHPQLSDELIKSLLQKRISMIGVDFAGVRRGREHTPKDQYCAEHGVFIIENLCNLKALTACEKLILYTLPMNYAGVTGLPCRVVAETGKEIPKFDSLDHRIRYVHLLMERDLADIPCHDLPEGYRFVFYQDGDRDTWIEIEKSAKEFSTYEEGLAAWEKYYQAHEEELPGRMLFMENAAGEKIATATAYYGVGQGENPNDAWLHWVSVKQEYQGKGLSRPLISAALNRLKDLGYSKVSLSTQTTTWLACRLYLDFGFRPTRENAREGALGWRIIKRLTNHPALREYPEATDQELLV